MKVVFSGLVSQASGKCGDVVASRNRYGQFLRVRIDTPQSPSSFWTNLRDYTLYLNGEWSLISNDERIQWNLAAETIRRSDALATEYRLSGFNYFQSVNINRWYCGLVPISLPPIRKAVAMLDFFNISANSAIPTITTSFSPAIPGDKFLKIWLTPNLSAGINRAHHQFRMVKVAPDSYASGSSILTEYDARFGSLFIPGAKIFFKAALIDSISGCQSQFYQGFSLVT